MPINIPTNLISGAVNDQIPPNPAQIKICKLPPEGAKAYAFTCYNKSNTSNPPSGAHFYDLTQGTNQTQFSQIVCMMIDTLLSQHDVTVIFPDTGDRYTVPRGDKQLFPVNTNGLSFFIVFGDNDNFAGDTSRADITVFNQFIPNFQNNIFSNQVIFGRFPAQDPNVPSQNPEPFFANFANKNLIGGNDITATFSGPLVTLAGIQLDLYASTNDGNPTVITVELNGTTTGVNYLRKKILITSMTPQFFPIWDLTELNINVTSETEFTLHITDDSNLNDLNFCGQIQAG